jgi:hypothetical protein
MRKDKGGPMNHKVRKRKARFEVVPIAEALKVARPIEDKLPADRRSGEKAADRAEKKAKKTPRVRGSR